MASFFRALIQSFGKRTGFVIVILLVTAYGYVALRGPQGIQALLEKRREIRQIEEQNASIAVENERRRERIRRLQESSSEQEMEIRKQLKLQRPGETTFILPSNGPSNGASNGNDGAENSKDGSESPQDGTVNDKDGTAAPQNGHPPSVE